MALARSKRSCPTTCKEERDLAKDIEVGQHVHQKYEADVGHHQMSCSNKARPQASHQDAFEQPSCIMALGESAMRDEQLSNRELWKRNYTSLRSFRDWSVRIGLEQISARITSKQLALQPVHRIYIAFEVWVFALFVHCRMTSIAGLHLTARSAECTVAISQ
eukprot:3400782-Amphidinium_carterae.1